MTTSTLNIALQHFQEYLEGKYSNVRTSFFKDIELNLIRAHCSDKVITPIRYVQQTIGIENCPWTNSWWAKLVRKLVKQRWFKDWLIPYPIQCLAAAQATTMTNKVEEISSSVLSEISHQINRLIMEGHKPYCIIIGRAKLDELRDLAIDFRYCSPLYPSRWGGQTINIMGLPAFSYHFADPNTVIVVPSHDNPR